MIRFLQRLRDRRAEGRYQKGFTAGFTAMKHARTAEEREAVELGHGGLDMDDRDDFDRGWRAGVLAACA